jgi:hypothetical protein
MSRYLSKICDQLVCLLSAYYSEEIVLVDEQGDEVDDLYETPPKPEQVNLNPGWLLGPGFVFRRWRGEGEKVVHQEFTVRRLIRLSIRIG